jgi:RP/EB family microtubule-associated protein
MEADPVLEEDEGSLLKQIQTILYSTEVSEADELSK